MPHAPVSRVRPAVDRRHVHRRPTLSADRAARSDDHPVHRALQAPWGRTRRPNDAGRANRQFGLIRVHLLIDRTTVTPSDRGSAGMPGQQGQQRREGHGRSSGLRWSRPSLRLERFAAEDAVSIGRCRGTPRTCGSGGPGRPAARRSACRTGRSRRRGWWHRGHPAAAGDRRAAGRGRAVRASPAVATESDGAARRPPDAARPRPARRRIPRPPSGVPFFQPGVRLRRNTSSSDLAAPDGFRSLGNDRCRPASRRSAVRTA